MPRLYTSVPGGSPFHGSCFNSRSLFVDPEMRQESEFCHRYPLVEYGFGQDLLGKP